MRAICFVVVFVIVSNFIDASGEISDKYDNVGLLTFTDNNKVNAEQRVNLQDSGNIANKNDSCDCGKNGICSFINGKKRCTCFDGYSEYNGTCMKCDCGGKWKNCTFYGIKQKRSCTCERGYAVERCYGPLCNDTCAECDCGMNGNCTFGYLGKTCDCDKGFASYNGKCRVCDCGKDGTCKFNSSVKVCICNNGYKDVNGKCKETCDCGVHGSCELINGGKVCNCDLGYMQYNGECKLCNCGIHGQCSFNYLREPKCVCDDGYAVYNGECYACGCGSNSTGCSFDSLSYRRQRLCSCKDGFIAKWDLFGNQVCEDCDCGKDEKCDLHNGVKRCLCSTGLREVNRKCLECDCGSNAVFCELDYFKYKKCTCKEGYYPHRRFSMTDDQCLSCSCGKNSIGCLFNTRGDRLCKCKYGNVIKDELLQCKECNCGSGGKSCFFTSSGKTQCTCYPAYELQYNWETGDYCSLIGLPNYGWKIATYVVSVITVVIIIGMLIIIADKRAFLNRMRRQQR